MNIRIITLLCFLITLVPICGFCSVVIDQNQALVKHSYEKQSLTCSDVAVIIPKVCHYYAYDGNPNRLRPLDGLWNEAKSYTAYLEKAYKAAKAAVEAAGAALAVATANLAQAKAALAAAGGTGAATTAAALADLAAAEAAVASAAAALAAAQTAALTAGAIFAGAVGGTLIGQGADWVISFCWDPICSCEYSASGIPYEDPTELESDLIVRTTLSELTGSSWTRAGFDTLGTGPQMAWMLMVHEARAFLAAQRGAAEAKVAVMPVTNRAVPYIQAELDSIPQFLVKTANALDEASIPSPADSIQAAFSRFEVSASQLFEQLDNHNQHYAEAVADLDTAENAFHQALMATSSMVSGRMTGPNGLAGTLSKAQFSAFVQECSTKGASALPAEETFVSDSVVAMASVRYPGISSVGTLIAQWEGSGTDSRELGMWGTDTALSLAQILRNSASVLSSSGPWLNIDLNTSALVRSLDVSSGGETKSNASFVIQYSNPQTPVISYSIPEREVVSLTLVNILGDELINIKYDAENSGLHRMEIPIRGLPSGMYIIRMIAGNYSQERLFSIFN